MTFKTPVAPPDEGKWTLLQSRMDRSYWQWDRDLASGILSRYVILRGEDRYDYDTFEEAEALFLTFDEDEQGRPQKDLEDQ